MLEPRVHLSGTVMYRVNCGGPQLNDVPVWTADTTASPSPYYNATASGNQADGTSTAINMSDPSVPPGTPQALFQSERYSLTGSSEMQYAFPVTPGSYTVRLYFAETFSGITTPGEREFNVAIDGTTVLSNYDVYAAVGAFTATVKTYNINQTTNSLSVNFTHVIQNPEIKGIEVIQNTLTPGTVQSTDPYLSFSSATLGTTESHTVWLSNFAATGSPSVTVNGISFTGTNASEFTSAFTTPVTLAPGQSTSFNITYTPSAIGAVAASMVVNQSSGGATVTPLQVPVSSWQLATTGGVTFGKSILSGTSLTNPTSLQFGPDNKLYVAQQSGLINIYTVSRTAANKYTVTNTQTITSIQSIPNHNDDGSLAPTVTTRLVTGILVVGTAANPVIYCVSSDPRLGGGDTGTFLNADSNSGILSRLTWNGATWVKQDLVDGLPRSEEDHSSEGLQLNAATNTLYIAQAGNTNEGAPSHDFNEYPEYALSSAILTVNLTAIGNTTYNLPDLVDDNAAVNAASPFGGDMGKHQAILVPGGPVQVYSTGWRNPYDIVLASNGYIYADDNGSNAGWGGPPILVNGIATNQPSEPGVTNPDTLKVITGPGEYFGFPNPTRASTTNTFNTVHPQSPVSVSDPVEGNYIQPGVGDGSLTTFPASTDGITQYTASDFGGALKGDLLLDGFSNQVIDVKLSANGLSATSVTGLFNNVGSTPLDVTTQGDSQIFPGTIWTCDYDTGAITVFEPADYGNVGAPGVQTFTGVDDPNVDEDGDGFSNHDEIVNGTNPTSAADQPHSWSGVKISDLLNPDDDGDGLPDTSDPFAIDPANGKNTNLPIHYDWGVPADNPKSGILNLGFTGLMTNGKSNYASLYDVNTLTAGGAAGVLTLDSVGSGDALGAANNQFDAFQFGINVNATSGPFTAHSTVVAPFLGLKPTAGQELGFYFGTGDQDNYVKVVVDGGGYVKVLEEINGVVTNTATSPLVTPGPDTVDLYFTVNPQTDTIQAAFTSTTAGVTSAMTNVGTALSIPASWFTATTAPAVGVIATNGGGASFSATWSAIDVVSAPPVESPYGGTAATIPGIIQAENYDNGGEGIAYHDTDAANLGGAYRNDGVDIESTGAGGYDVGWVKAGEWINYTVNVTTAGNYIFQPRVACLSTGGTFHINIDGTNVTGTMTIPSTGAWQTYTTISSGAVPLTAGTHILQLAMDTNGSTGYVGNFDSIQVVTATATVPYLGAPVALPGTIMADNFDNGGENAAYYDTTPGNQGGAYRSTDVDVEVTSDTATPPNLTSTSPGVGYSIGHITQGEWEQYTFSVATAGKYDFNFRIASGAAGGSFNMNVIGTTINSEIPFPNTGSWTTWQTVTEPAISLPAGTNVLRITFDTSYAPELGCFGWVSVTPTASVAETPFLGTPFTIGQTIQADNFDNGGEGVAYHDTDGVNQGGVYRNTGVDLEVTSDVPGPGETTSSPGEGFDVGHIAPSEYMQYTITAATAGTYSIDTRVANLGGTGLFHYAVDGVNATGEITFPTTGGWQTWQTVTTNNVNLTAGQHIIRMMFDTSNAPEFGNVNWFRIYTPTASPSSMVAQLTAEIAPITTTTTTVDVQTMPTAMVAQPTTEVAPPKHHKKDRSSHALVGTALQDEKDKKHDRKPLHHELLDRLLKKMKRNSHS
jgi:Malectin domain/Carbohydrate binding module (family 6)/Transmembrane protein 131-like N-terminal